MEASENQSAIDQDQVAKDKQKDLINEWEIEFVERVKKLSNSKKKYFYYEDALSNVLFHTGRDLCFIEAREFLNNKPLADNDYLKYASCYAITGKKLKLKYFKNNVEKLNDYYKKIDDAKRQGKTYNPFSKLAYRNYVLFMVLKLRGQYLKTDDELFNVKIEGNREYSPLSKIPSVLRGELPFKVKEYDIKRAFPTFIDMELNTDFRNTVYSILDKKTFAYLLNVNVTNEGADRKKALKELSKVYGKDADKVLSLERFKTKGLAFNELVKYEKEAIDQFATVNKLVNYVRLHDGVVVLAETKCDQLVFDKVVFAIKQCVKPVVENERINFYQIGESTNKVITSPTMYAEFFIQEKFKRISTPDDKIQLIRDTNNVVDFFNHNTDTVSFLKNNINEFGDSFDAVADTIAKENFSVIRQGFLLIPPKELKYYTDSKTRFGIPFKNGFFYFDDDTFEIKRESYSKIKGFFSPHKVQSRNFEYTEEVGMFQEFLTRAVLKKDNKTLMNDANDAEKSLLFEFGSMIGYLCHSYKSQTNNPCIILTDMDANDENRNGRRGKTLVSKAIQEVTTTMIKGGNEFNAGYNFVFADLEKKHKVYVIDDVPAGFKYDDLYTNVLGGINCQRKGSKAELIPFEESPKFLITSNWVVRYDPKNASTNKRFLEYKFTDYYNSNHSPKDDFNCEFFTDWDEKEWNRFYSFIFNCVKSYMVFGLKQIPYDKERDNYLVAFENHSMTEEFERIINYLMQNRQRFTVNNFLETYNHYENILRHEKFFNHKNVKKLIDVWLNDQKRQGHYHDWIYSQRDKLWYQNLDL